MGHTIAAKLWFDSFLKISQPNKRKRLPFYKAMMNEVFDMHHRHGFQFQINIYNPVGLLSHTVSSNCFFLQAQVGFPI